MKKTSEQELFLLSTARIEIKRSEVPYIKKEFLSYEINFYLSAADYGSIENVIPSIRKNLKLKAKIVFQWFPQCVVEDIRVLVLQA